LLKINDIKENCKCFNQNFWPNCIDLLKNELKKGTNSKKIEEIRAKFSELKEISLEK